MTTSTSLCCGRMATGRSAPALTCPKVHGGWISRFDQVDPGAVLGPKYHSVWQPVIAALHGMVAGGAMYFVNESDFAICSDTATFFDPHVNVGIVSALEPMGIPWRMPTLQIPAWGSQFS